MQVKFCNNNTFHRNVTCVHFDPIETEMLYSGGEDGCVRIWDTRSDKQNKQRKKQFETPIQSIFLHPDRKEIYIADQSGSIYIWTILKDKLKRIFVTNDGFVNSIAYDHDCRLLAAIDTKGFVYIFRTMDKVDRPSLNDESGEMSCTRSFQRRAMFKAHTKQGLKCTFSPDSTLLATSSADQSIKFWKTSDFSIMNPAGVVQFDDPFESIQDKATGHASSASTIRRGSTTVTSTFKNTYSNNIENESELNQFGSSTNSFLPSPYSMGLYSYAFGGGESQQASRLPACFLKPKRNRCQMCHNLSSSNKASSDETSQTDRKNCSMGRSLYHIPGCKSSPQSSYGLGNMYSQLQTNLNSFSQLTWNVIESKMNDTIVGSSDSDVKSSPLTCNHYSHFSESFQLLKHSTNHVHQTNASHIPAYYTRYFDNPYYDIYSGNMAFTDKEIEEEDEEFYKILKKINLVNNDDDDDYDEGKNDSDGYGERDEEKNNGRQVNIKSKQKSIFCCDCDHSKIKSQLNSKEIDNDETKNDKRKRNSFSGNQLVNRPLGKNQWPFTTVTPVRTLTANNQRWVWDITFTADSQYLFSGKLLKVDCSNLYSFYYILLNLQHLLMVLFDFGQFSPAILYESIVVI